ncbi:Nif3-like dinuclear metal center hexameric protein [Sedimenticola thiotaurini]|uniref:Metal-binding protein n=1 Tax=Sedimenticola thiotaurini TaxID=1543721 RepID=A0A0F7K344_9GAMM|nr:Nif3-like dinuclear metal center hexameric protein [Sedimenticola thiotaurini]AKH22237.1 metal-binding protein [Sedimenticola thiotaurini]
MIGLVELETYCNRLLDAGSFEDYCPNGLQLDAGRPEIQRLATGVTASQAVIEAAARAEADLLLVHHGYFWRGEAAPLTGVKGRRVRSLMSAGISMMAYHLPLDAHPELGNNRALGDLLEIGQAQPLGSGLVWQGELAAESPSDLAGRMTRLLGRTPLLIPGGDRPIRRIGWCTGAAQGAIVEAAAAGLDAFISGEVSEATTHLARELGIHYFAAGHHATERYGVQALGRHLAEKFSLDYLFIDDDNPA